MLPCFVPLETVLCHVVEGCIVLGRDQGCLKLRRFVGSCTQLLEAVSRRWRLFHVIGCYIVLL